MKLKALSIFGAACAMLALASCGSDKTKETKEENHSIEFETYSFSKIAEAVKLDSIVDLPGAKYLLTRGQGVLPVKIGSTDIKPLRDTLLAGDDCYRPLRESYPFLISGTWRVKSVVLSHQWSYTGYTGVYCPWLGEASVNVDVPPCELGHTVTHELAHTMGFAREDECNFIGYLACVESGDPDYVYSGYLSAYIYCSNALYAYDKDMWRECYQHIGEGVRRDLKQRNAYWKQFEGQVQESSQKVNDAFIKANGDEKGTLSYGQMVAFVLRWYDAQGAFSG